MADDDATTSLENRVLDLAHFIGAPLVAVVEADAMAADTFRKFLEQVAFEPADPATDDDPDADPEEDAAREAEVKRLMGVTGRRLGRLRYVSFSYDHVQDGQRVTSVVKVPLLSLIPLPALQVKEAKFDWTLDIVSSRRLPPPPPPLRKKTAQAAAAGAAPGAAGFTLPGAMGDQRRLLAAISPGGGGGAAAGAGREERDSRVSARMKVEVTMQSADMPSGLSTLLNVMSQGTNGVTLSGKHAKAAEGDDAGDGAGGDDDGGGG